MNEDINAVTPASNEQVRLWHFHDAIRLHLEHLAELTEATSSHLSNLAERDDGGFLDHQLAHGNVHKARQVISDARRLHTLLLNPVAVDADWLKARIDELIVGSRAMSYDVTFEVQVEPRIIVQPYADVMVDVIESTLFDHVLRFATDVVEIRVRFVPGIAEPRETDAEIRIASTPRIASPEVSPEDTPNHDVSHHLAADGAHRLVDAYAGRVSAMIEPARDGDVTWYQGHPIVIRTEPVTGEWFCVRVPAPTL